MDGSHRDQAQEGGDLVPGAALRATRSLLDVATPEDAHQVARELVETLGGTVVPADQAGTDALPADVSFGVGGPALPVAPTDSVARMHLERYLPAFVADANRALQVALHRQRLTEDSSQDPLTGLANRRMATRALGRLHPGEAVVLVDLDHFKDLNDTLGHEEGDRVLAAFGQCLRETVRGRDMACRYGGEEFLLVLVDGTDPEGLLVRLQSRWEQHRPHPVTFSAGIARVGDDSSTAFSVADDALYRAKDEGRDQWAWGSSAAAADPTPTPPRPVEPFVAFSQLVVPADGAGALEQAFAERLGAVDQWPGFRRLEAWRDLGDPERHVLVTWWDSAADFHAYMGSRDHRRSHQRIPDGQQRPRPDRFTRYQVIAR